MKHKVIKQEVIILQDETVKLMIVLYVRVYYSPGLYDQQAHSNLTYSSGSILNILINKSYTYD